MSRSLLKLALKMLPGSKPAANRFRNRAVRVPTTLSVNWTTAGAEYKGELANLSSTGCYIATTNELHVGDVVEIELTIPGRLTVTLKGPVARANNDKGFGLRFRRLTATQQLLLEHAVWHLSSLLEHNRPIRERIEKGWAGNGALRKGQRLGGRLVWTA